MDSSPPAKPKPEIPPKPTPLRSKELITAERFFKENPIVSRQKPPLAPKPLLPTKRVCPLIHQKLQGRISNSSLNIVNSVCSSDQVLSDSQGSEVLSETKTVQYQEIVASLRGQHESESKSELRLLTLNTSVITSVGTSQCDAERIVKDTWASLQEKSIISSTNIVSANQNNKSDLILSKLKKNSSSLYPSDFNNTLPFKVSDNVNIFDLNNDSNNFSTGVENLHRPSLEFSPPTPDDETLVSKENSSDLLKLPVNNESCLNESSLHSNLSFVHPSNKSRYSDTSSELKGSNIETSTPNSLTASISVGDVTLRSKKSSDSTRGVSWSEDDVSRNRTNSEGNESFDGSNTTVRRRISSFFGSFGKGGKTKEKRESSLFYYNPGDDSSQMESSDSGRTSVTSLSETQNSASNNTNIVDSPSDSKQFLNVSNDCFEGSSNRSSISDESFDAENFQKSVSVNQDDYPTSTDPAERKKRKCFLIVNELMTSERVFIDVLKLLCHDFKNAVDEASNQQRSPVIPPSDFNKIINNLPQLLSLNEDLLKDIESRIERWNELPKVSDVIVKKGPFLKLYSSYIQNFEAQTDFLDECCEKYRKFAQVVKDFEKSDRCKKLALKHYMLKPIQRIPQYKLLLDDYLEHLDPDSLDYVDTKAALNIVCDVANHANQSIKQGDHLSKLLSIQSQLGDYEIIKPGRHFVKEGELYKLCRKDMQQRFFILLSDCLLYTSYYGSMTGLKVKCKLPLAGMKVSVSQNNDCPTEFSVITSTRSFTLRAKNKEEFTEWVNTLQDAIKDYNSRQMTFLHKHNVPMSASAEPLKIGREAPVWIQDKRVTMCQICTAEFTMTFRRHHCRACGKVVCSACSDYRAPMKYLRFNSDRVCTECYKYLLTEIEESAPEMMEVVKKDLGLFQEEDLTLKMIEIRSSFKKFGQSTGKKVKKYIPQRLKEVTANDSDSQMSGWLLRRSKGRWKRLWFVLKEQVLYAYRASEDVVASQSIPVLGYEVEKVPESEYDDMSGESKFLFRLVHPGQPPLMFATDTHSAERWMFSLQEATLLK